MNSKPTEQEQLIYSTKAFELHSENKDRILPWRFLNSKSEFCWTAASIVVLLRSWDGTFGVSFDCFIGTFLLLEFGERMESVTAKRENNLKRKVLLNANLKWKERQSYFLLLLNRKVVFYIIIYRYGCFILCIFNIFFDFRYLIISVEMERKNDITV